MKTSQDFSSKFIISSVFCKDNEIYSECGFNSCQKSCSLLGQNVACRPSCAAGCICIDGYIHNDDGLCIKIEDCPGIAFRFLGRIKSSKIFIQSVKFAQLTKNTASVELMVAKTRAKILHLEWFVRPCAFQAAFVSRDTFVTVAAVALKVKSAQ